MAVTVDSSNPAALLADIKKKIDEGHIETWSYDSDGDFTHTPPQWLARAWLKPVIATGKLSLGIIAPKDTKLSRAVFGVYQGRFIEMLVSHEADFFSSARATPFLTSPDQSA